MLGDVPVFDMTLVAGEDLTNHMYKAVKLNASGQAVKAVAGDGMWVLQNTPKVNAAAAVRVHGISFGYLTGAVTAGNRVTSDVTGGIVAATKAGVAAAAITGTTAIGIALKTGVVGDLIPILMDRQEVSNT